MRFLILYFSLLLLSACSENTPMSSDSTTQSPTDPVSIEVIDFAGTTIKLKQPAGRIVALAPHIVENVFAAGAGATLIGVVDYSDYPEQAKSLPLVAGYEQTNYEKILELNPDLIFAWQSGNSEESVVHLRELGFTVYLDQPKSLEDIAKSIRDIGVLTGHSDTAENIASEYLEKIDDLKLRYRNAKPVPIFYQVWNRPLQTINGDSIISSAIEVCAGNNIYANEAMIAPVINIESILERDPAAIIASGMSDARPEWLDDWKQWDSLTAVKNQNLFFVDPDHIQRHTVRLLHGIETVCSQLDLVRKREFKK